MNNLELGYLRYKGLMYGNGLWATIIEVGPIYLNKVLNIEMARFLIIPSDILKETYRIQDTDLNIDTPMGKAQWREYPRIMVQPLNDSQSYGVTLIYCAYDGGETPLMQVKDLPSKTFMKMLIDTNFWLQEQMWKYKDGWIMSEEEKRVLLGYHNEYSKLTNEWITSIRSRRTELEDDSNEVQGTQQK